MAIFFGGNVGFDDFTAQVSRVVFQILFRFSTSRSRRRILRFLARLSACSSSTHVQTECQLRIVDVPFTD